MIQVHCKVLLSRILLDAINAKHCLCSWGAKGFNPLISCGHKFMKLADPSCLSWRTETLHVVIHRSKNYFTSNKTSIFRDQYWELYRVVWVLGSQYGVVIKTSIFTLEEITLLDAYLSSWVFCKKIVIFLSFK